MTRIADVRAANRTHGALVVEDYRGLELPAAHTALGRSVGPAAQAALAARLEQSTPEKLARQLRQARACLDHLSGVAGSAQIAPLLRAAVNDYLACLAGWAEGAGLAAFDHPALTGLLIGAPSSAPDGLALAMLLQHDNTG
ncbi:MAG: hypothetical protein ACKOC5_06850, partial [Chloroflexota bacterium]